MHIQSNARYLEIINHGLMHVLAPNIENDQAKAVVGILHGALKELYKREHRTPELLASWNQKGLVLAQQLQSLVGELDSNAVANSSEFSAIESAMNTQDFNSLRAVNNRLNAHIEKSAKQLTQLRGNDLSSVQQEKISDAMRQSAEWDYGYSVAQREAIEFESFDLGAPPEGDDVNLENLQQFVDEQRPGEGIKVSGMSNIPGGMGKHTYKCTFTKPDESTEDVVIRKQDVSPVFTRGAWSIDAEYLLVKILSDIGYNVPKPLMLAHNEKAFDSDFFIMEKKEGIVPGNFFGATMDIEEALLLDLAENMAKLHSIEIDTFSGYVNQYLSPELLQADIKTAYRLEIESWLEYAEQKSLTSSPALMYTLDWLLENIPENTQKPVLVHGDFNIHNFLVQGNTISTVLDWEMALFGDPAQDIAYIKPNIEQYIDWDKFMAHYYACGGRKVDESTFNYYIAFANTRPMIGSLSNMGLFDQAKTQDVRVPYIDTEFLPQFTKNILDNSGQ